MEPNQKIIHSISEISQNQDESQLTSHSKYQDLNSQQEMTMIQKATLIVDTLTNQLCNQIIYGNLYVDDQQKQLPIQRKSEPMTKNQLIMSKLQEVNIEEHRQKIKSLMEASKIMRKKRSRRFLQFENSIKKLEEDQNKKKQLQKNKQLERRKSLIESRMAQKVQMMAKIRMMSLESNQRQFIQNIQVSKIQQFRVKSVKNKKFLYEQKEQEFKQKYLLPKIQQERKMLERRKQKMKSIDIQQLLQHQKTYQVHRKNQIINRSMTSRIMKSQTMYNPPEYVPKSYLLYEAEQYKKRQQQMLKIKEASINKQRVKQFVKNVSDIHKLQKQISRQKLKSMSNQKSQQIIQGQSPSQQFNNENKETKSPSKKDKKKKKSARQLSKQQTINVGNEYFKALLQQIKKVKQKREKRQKQKEQLKKQQQKQKEQNNLNSLELEIQSQEIRTIQKIQKIERSYKVRSKKIQSIFNDSKIDPVLKFQKLKHEVENLDMSLKTKNMGSQDIKQRTEAAGCYLNAIKAKLKLLQHSNKK